MSYLIETTSDGYRWWAITRRPTVSAARERASYYLMLNPRNSFRIVREEANA